MDFLKTLADYSFQSPYNAIVNTIGLIGIFYLAYVFLAKREEGSRGERLVTVISAICVIAYWALITSYNPAFLDNPSTYRYYLLFFTLLPISALLLMSHAGFFTRKPAYVLALAMLIFFLYQPASVEDKFSKASYWPREYRFVKDFLDKAAARDRAFLVIYAKPGQLTVSNYGAVNFDYANSHNMIDLYARNRLFNNIFVVQAIMYDTMQPAPECQIDGRFALQKLVERQVSDKKFIRISRVTAISK